MDDDEDKDSRQFENLQALTEFVMNTGKKGLTIQRYKGLGEMNAQQLWDTTMDPEYRVFKQVTIEDALEADEMFKTLMGKDVEIRKNFIMRHAKEVTNLDI